MLKKRASNLSNFHSIRKSKIPRISVSKQCYFRSTLYCMFEKPDILEFLTEEARHELERSPLGSDPDELVVSLSKLNQAMLDGLRDCKIHEMPQNTIEELQTKWLAAMNCVGRIREKFVTEAYPKCESVDQYKTWIGRLGNVFEQVSEVQKEFYKDVGKEFFNIEMTNNISDLRCLGIYYQANERAQDTLIEQSQEWQNMSVREFNNMFMTKEFKQKVLFPELFKEEMILLEEETKIQNVERAKIFEEVCQQFDDGEMNEEIREYLQRTLDPLNSVEGWLQYKLQLGFALARNG